jgi:hypothetical protein
MSMLILLTELIFVKMRISSEKNHKFGLVQGGSDESNFLKVSYAFGRFAVELLGRRRDQLLLVLQSHQLFVSHDFRRLARLKWTDWK